MWSWEEIRMAGSHKPLEASFSWYPYCPLETEKIGSLVTQYLWEEDLTGFEMDTRKVESKAFLCFLCRPRRSRIKNCKTTLYDSLLTRAWAERKNHHGALGEKIFKVKGTASWTLFTTTAKQDFRKLPAISNRKKHALDRRAALNNKGGACWDGKVSAERRKSKETLQEYKMCSSRIKNPKWNQGNGDMENRSKLALWRLG